MSIEQSVKSPLTINRPHAWTLGKLLRSAMFAVILLVALALLGRSNVDAVGSTWLALNGVVTGWGWDLVGWETAAIVAKVSAGVSQPVQHLTGEERSAVVRGYMDRAQRIAEFEREINTQSAAGSGQTAEIARLQAEIDRLRHQQHLRRSAVEQIIEGQVGAQLAASGMQVGNVVVPPVLFTFSEPPRKLIVSPRDRIDTVYWAMLDPELPADQREQIETTILGDANLSAYVTNIGGLGAYPTLVIERGSLEWVLSTVAHEWVHNYLTLFPLGISYGQTADLTILNETVADIVGDEIGATVVMQHYPELAPPPMTESAVGEPIERTPAVFDFDREMRHTREIVDLFLSFGRVTDAEAYMEIRRLLFVENGFNLRKLNQAYFAFHGNYGTGAAASSPIGPDLQRLRTLTPDLRTFLETVRWFTSAEDLQQAIDERAAAGAAP